MFGYQIVSLALFGLICSATMRNEWRNFKREFKKEYATLQEDENRFKIFEANMIRIYEHNRLYSNGKETYKMGTTQFADMTHEEFKKILKIKKQSPPTKIRITLNNGNIPSSFDWRDKGVVTPVKNQGTTYANSWAFTAVAAVESQFALVHRYHVNLSEQQLLDCSDSDCSNGGHVLNAYKFISIYGLSGESSYPYIGKKGSCRTEISGTRIQGYKSHQLSETALKNGLYEIGPMSISINAEGMQLYKEGIFQSPFCDNNLNHAALLVGYGNEKLDYWIIKNSWGENWGENGYIRLIRNANQCGVNNDVSYPYL